MKKDLFLLLLALMSFTGVSAKLNGSGYYRIWNAAVEVNQKERAYCCVTYNSYKMNNAAGTQQDIDAIPLYPGDYAQHCDPAAVIYVRMSPFDLMAQGVSVSTIISGSSLTLTGNNDGEYVLTGRAQGVDSPVYSTSYKKLTDGVQHYILTSANSNTSYKYWSAAKVDSESDEWYLGVQPTLEANGKYYAPYYVSFPFETKSEGMKVYYVSEFTDGGYILKELKGIVPAATPVLIECSSNNPSDNRLTLHEPGTPGTPATGNCLKGNYYYNPDLGLTLYPGSVTEFNAKTMRVWNVENGKLVLSTATSGLKYARVGSNTYLTCLNPNQSYLVVPSTAAETLREGVSVTVTFDTDGGSTVAPLSGISGESLTAPAAPTKEGYTFAGWDNLPATFPASDITVKAKWTPNQYTLTFDTDGGSTIEPITLGYGSDLTAPAAPTKAGYTFAGWEPEMPATMPLNGATLKAQWTPNQYTLTFDTNGGSAIEPVTLGYGSAITPPAAPTKEGHTFIGWEPEVPATMPFNDITVKAQWEVNKYAVRFVMDDGTVISESTLAYGSAIVPPAAPTKVGSDFLGWSPAVPATVPASDVTYTATFSGNTYTITFNTNGGSAIEPISGLYGSAVTRPVNPTREGYTFAGWDREVPATIPAGDVTIEAQWTPNQYTITFDTDGGSAVEAIAQGYGSDLTAPANPTKEGYTFAGWEPEIPATMPLNGITVKAQWTVNQYTITFNTDGGSAIAPITADYGSIIELPSIAPTKAGYSFNGWAEEVPATMPAGDIVLTALWQRASADCALTLTGGWNWVAFPMYQEDMSDVSTMLANGEWTSGDEMKTRTDVAAYTQQYGKWVGSLTRQGSLASTSMYKVHSNKAQAVPVKANIPVLIPSEVALTVDAGWNYIAYLPGEDMPLSEALADYSASEGDVIKSQDASSTYSDATGWVGDLDVLRAGKGYMLKRVGTGSVSFNYPDEGTKVESAASQQRAYRFADNMTVVASVADMPTEAGDSIVAMVNGDVRGAAAVAEGGSLVLTVQGDKAETVSLALVRDGEVFAMARTSLCYETDAVVGSLASPTAISFVEEDADGASLAAGNVVAIYSVDGVKCNTLSVKALPAGAYIVYTEADGKTSVTKITKK